jgi:adenylate kinase
MTINLKMKTSDAFKDKELPEGEEETEELMAKLRFPWRCEKGIVENSRQLNEEFNLSRGLQPVKMVISGPPASGKTHYSHKVSAFFNIPRVHVKELTDRAFKMCKTEEEEGLAAEVKAKIEELRDAEVARIEE